MTASIDEEFIRISFALWLDRLINEGFGDNRDGLDVTDAEAGLMIIRVIHEGMLHREAAEGLCSEAELQTRHQEYVHDNAVRQFLANWPEFRQALQRPPHREL
ncbi:hypothetical protein QFZ53_003703 [Microbacterium natoriense]|uniref:Uncharacterized protein n=1 Tax=Microbacterium natoriense TaxID=284570 RepID=A0AAW8F1U3_9MICO|nr:hypothetical protein [Microbacterium natoriense]MDQ0649507.1 hypothetical protein [Microbacterium natoriense]